MAHFSLRFLAVLVFGLANARRDERWTNRGKVQPKRFWSFPTFKTPPQWQRGQLAKTYLTPDRKSTKWGWDDFKCAFGRCHSDGSILGLSPRAVATKPPQASRPISKPAQPSPTRPKFRPPVARKQPRVYRPTSCSSNEEVRVDRVHEMACVNVVAYKRMEEFNTIGLKVRDRPDMLKDMFRELENLKHDVANSPTQQKCFCMAGFVRSYKGGPCVAASTCDTMCTDEFEAMSNVGADSTCQMHRPRITTPAVAKCLCLPGFVRSHGDCHPRSMCEALNVASVMAKQLQHSEQVVRARLRSMGVDLDMAMSIDDDQRQTYLKTLGAPTIKKIDQIMEEEVTRTMSGMNTQGMDPMMLAMMGSSIPQERSRLPIKPPS